jgi:GntR family transcriptional regulator/MocR family aminotransferase
MYGIIIKKNRSMSQYRQLYEQLRDKIIRREIPASTKLASTRTLAQELRLSRTVVLEVIDQLKVEGYVETRHGSGTYTASGLYYTAGIDVKPQAPPPGIQRQKHKSDAVNFLPGTPDLRLFPRRAWNRVYIKSVEYAHDKDLSYGPPEGSSRLREAVAGFLFRCKGIRAHTDNIFITSGVAQGISLLAELTSRVRGRVVLEDPLVSFVYDIFSAYDCRIDFADVDREGIVPDSFSARDAALIYVSPSHQFPLGGTLSAGRRMKLLDKAAAAGCLLIEDDYDGEFRYGSRPIAPLQVLAAQKVVYMGTFSKNMAPSLRLGYMVVPDDLVEPLQELKLRVDRLSNGLCQLTLARFISEGLLERHIAKMRKVYRKKQETLKVLLKDAFGDAVEISGQTTGLHLVLRFPGYLFREDALYKLKQKGLRIEPVSAYCIKTKAHHDKLVLGYGQVREQDIARGIRVLKEYIAGLRPTHGPPA